MSLFKKKKQSSRKVGKTLVNGKSLSTNNYYRPKNSLPAAKKARVSTIRPDRQLTLSGFINSVIVVLVIVVLFFASTLSTTPSVAVLDQAYAFREQSDYTLFAQEYLKNSTLSRSKLLFRSIEFEQVMQEQFPEIDKISAIVPLGGRKLDVNMRLSDPLATVMSGSQKGVIDTRGLLIPEDLASLSSSDVASSIPILRFSAPQENFVSGATLLTSSEVELLQLIVTELESFNNTSGDSLKLQPSEFLFNITDGQLELRFRNQPLHVMFSVYSDIRLQVGTMLATIAQLNGEGQLPSSYIDVRVPGKVYVK